MTAVFEPGQRVVHRESGARGRVRACNEYGNYEVTFDTPAMAAALGRVFAAHELEVEQ